MMKTPVVSDTHQHAFGKSNHPSQSSTLSVSVRTIQFLRFRLPSGGEKRFLEAHKAAVESCRASYEAFRAAFLVRLEDGDWLDISVWGSAVDGGSQLGCPPLDARTEFIRQLDGLLGDENGILVSSFVDSSFGCE